MIRMDEMSVRLGIDDTAFVQFVCGVPDTNSPRPLQGERAGRGGQRVKRHIETRKRAKILRTNLTEPERRLWYRLRANRLGVKFQRQVVLAPYIADFATRSERLV